MTNTARLVQSIEGKLIVTEFEIDNLIPAMEIRGYAFTRVNTNSRQRAELQGQPMFKGVNGPMWDGNAIRYEDTEAYAQLSA